MQLTELLAKPLINPSAAAHLGSVYAFWTDNKMRRVRYLVAVDEDTYADTLAYPFGKVYFGKDAVLATGESQTANGVAVPFKGEVYDTDGNHLGYLQDVICTDKGYVEHLLLTDGSTKTPEQVVAIGGLVIVQGTRKVGRSRPKPQRTPAPAEAFNLPVKTTPAEQLSEREPIEPDPIDSPSTDPAEIEREPLRPVALTRAPLPQEVNALPQGLNVRLVGDYSFLLGRTLAGDLTHHGRTLLAQGSVIDETAVALARANGLLVTLTALSV